MLERLLLGPATVAELTQQLGGTSVAVTQIASKLSEGKLITIETPASGIDKTCKLATEGLQTVRAWLARFPV